MIHDPLLCRHCIGKQGIPAKHCKYVDGKFYDNCEYKSCICNCRKFFLDEQGRKHLIYRPKDNTNDVKGGLDNWV